ncbi:hydroxypyruvate isomerase [Labrys okinawensis]|uniref:Hydroxypyruvate isomerase n=1 Tax=Labrys okinawensis TaxID=346911 RepID=A0A2S9QBZ8_9HYPH|nr:hydroxypyruvate isomerase [Labrys okinawensis]PRH86871.1 hydroxypyruvate isomerase [Labrys okinawensis]
MPRFAANISMLFSELNFYDRFEAAAKAGFAGVEFPFPYDFDRQELRRRLDANGLALVLHNLPPGRWGDGERGLACLPDRKAEFRESVALALDHATLLGCSQVNCLSGIPPKGADPKLIRDTLLDNLRFAADEAGRAGIRLLVEAINTIDMPGFYLNRSRQAIEIIEEVGSDNLYFQYDIYHMQVMEGDLARSIESQLARIAHLQLADNPGRHEPGTGEINYPFLFGHIDRIGYRGWIGAEYRPLRGTVEGLGWLPDRS